MSIWVPDLGGRSAPLYRAIVDVLAEDIAAGRLSVGSRLPPHRDLAIRLKVTVGTIARAYREAARRGLVTGEVGRGTFVLAPGSEDIRSVHEAVTSGFRDTDDGTGGNGAIDMALNIPSGDNCAQPVAQALHQLAEHPRLSHLLGYQLDLVPQRYRAAGAAWLARDGIAVEPSQIVLTVGGQQAIIAVLAALSRPGETVFTEELTYPGVKVSAGLLDRKVEGLAMDQDGLIPEAVEAALERGQGRVIYTMPTNHNPTVATMPAERRRRLTEIVRAHDAVLVEDGIYAFLADAPPPPLWALAPERTIYVTSLSKAVAPGLRIGFAAVPDALVSRVSMNISANTLMVPPLLSELAAMLIEGGAAEKAAAAQKDEMRERMQIATKILGVPAPAAGPALNLWLSLPPPWHAGAFAAEAFRRGVLVAPGGSFATTRRVPEAVRVSISAPVDRNELRRGLDILRRMLAGVAGHVSVTV